MTYWETGWVSPVGGFHARGSWRIQRLTTGWHWHCVLGSGIQHPHAGKAGKAPTLRAAKAAVDREEGATVPPPGRNTTTGRTMTQETMRVSLTQLREMTDSQRGVVLDALAHPRRFGELATAWEDFRRGADSANAAIQRMSAIMRLDWVPYRARLARKRRPLYLRKGGIRK